ncbi:MAG: hypothetical protein ACI8R4_003959 [Paracoccaceae bacterium]|jgi:hypothetical protein
MINELVIHLGDNKTGSTSIQQALVRNLCTTPGKSIYYPANLNHNSLAQTLIKERLRGVREDCFNALNQFFKKDESDYGIVSGEHFQKVDPQDLHDAIATYWPDLADRIRLIAYVRPHCDKMLSAFSENVKNGVNLQSMEDLFDASGKSGVFDYTKRFGKWRQIFGDRFELRPFVRENLFKGDVVADFFKYVLGNEDFTITDTVSANKSMTISQLAMLREMHTTLKQKIGGKKVEHFWTARSELGRLLAEYLQMNGLGQDQDKPRMPESLVAPFIKRYGEDAAALDAEFFDDTPMSDAMDAIHLKTISTEQSQDAADYFHPDAIKSTQAFANVLGDLFVQAPDEFKKAAVRARVKIKTTA